MDCIYIINENANDDVEYVCSIYRAKVDSTRTNNANIIIMDADGCAPNAHTKGDAKYAHVE